MAGLYEEYQNGTEQEDPAVKAAFSIMADVFGRSGIGNELQACDDEILDEILSEWVGLFRQASE